MKIVDKILFKEDYNIGHSVIDHQHKMIINEINGFIKEANNNVDAEFAKYMLNELYKEYTRHYAYEEKLLSKIDDIDFKEHQDKHNEATQYLESIIDAINKKEEVNFKEIAELLKIKATNHILEDMELKNKFVESVHF